MKNLELYGILKNITLGKKVKDDKLLNKWYEYILKKFKYNDDKLLVWFLFTDFWDDVNREENIMYYYDSLEKELCNE